jgi:hypothetical protein
LGEQEGDQFFGLLFIILLLFAAGGFAWCRWPQGSPQAQGGRFFTFFLFFFF